MLEELILGSMLMDEQALIKGLSELNENHFKVHKSIFKVIKETYEKEKAVDIGLLAINGAKFETLKHINSQVSTSVNIDRYIEQARSKKYVEDCKEYAHKIINAKGYDEINQVIDQQPILNSKKQIISTEEGLRQSLLRLKDRVKGKNELKGYRTGFNSLDRLTGGFKKGEVILIEGKTNAGKSIVAQNMAIKMARKNFIIWFGLEMPKSQLMDRMAMMYLNIYTSKNYNLPKSIQLWQDEKLKDFKDGGAIKNLFIVGMDELRYKTLSEIKAITYNEMNKRRNKPTAIFIDYLRLIREGKGEKSYERMQNNFEKIMDYASELMVPIVLIVSQNKMGQTAGSSDMLYDAHQHYVLSRDGVSAELEIIKNRDGEKGVIDLVWIKDYLRFEVAN